MARVIGTAGRYAGEQLSKKWVAVCLFLCIGEFAAGGLFVAAVFVNKSLLAGLALITISVAGLLVAKKILHKMERETRSWEKGWDGEVAVGRKLADELPRSYCVIHDLTTDFSNLDHVVVGPTGVFAVETKNWRGLVTADGNNELLLNGSPTDKPFIRQFTRSIMEIKDRWSLLAKTGRFIQGVMVFPTAYEKAPWGETGNVHCISINRIPSYFLNEKPKQPLSSAEVSRLARAFLALARMDEDFDPISDEAPKKAPKREGVRSS